MPASQGRVPNAVPKHERCRHHNKYREVYQATPPYGRYLSAKRHLRELEPRLQHEELDNSRTERGQNAEPKQGQLDNTATREVVHVVHHLEHVLRKAANLAEHV
eukprot:CAMPEP_0182545030 /NCGR_PEP_ID=MMETSP1323-20130603/34009_1 /TAXON_ID=236787 /ORGANISM="Florenciella parvula, Strain RCC1693" /LENGTH=103 /DNA_ID=CAMNT_0024756141 /DNA_START=30 /DNA_END=341 /DNA_ORIENTATION=+